MTGCGKNVQVMSNWATILRHDANIDGALAVFDEAACILIAAVDRPNSLCISSHSQVLH